MMNPQPSLRPTTVDLLMNERVRSNMTKTQELVFKEYHTGKKAVQQSSTFSGFWDYLKYINNFFKRWSSCAGAFFLHLYFFQFWNYS